MTNYPHDKVFIDNFKKGDLSKGESLVTRILHPQNNKSRWNELQSWTNERKPYGDFPIKGDTYQWPGIFRPSRALRSAQAYAHGKGHGMA